MEDRKLITKWETEKRLKRVETNFNNVLRSFGSRWRHLTAKFLTSPPSGDTELTAMHGKIFFETNKTKLKTGRGTDLYRATKECEKSVGKIEKQFCHKFCLPAQ